MPVIINNVSEEHGVEYGRGEQHYELCINNYVKAKFTHNFEDGLSTCLRKAADAFDRQEAKNFAELFELCKKWDNETTN